MGEENKHLLTSHRGFFQWNAGGFFGSQIGGPFDDAFDDVQALARNIKDIGLSHTAGSQDHVNGGNRGLPLILGLDGGPQGVMKTDDDFLMKE